MVQLSLGTSDEFGRLTAAEAVELRYLRQNTAKALCLSGVDHSVCSGLTAIPGGKQVRGRLSWTSWGLPYPALRERERE